MSFARNVCREYIFQPYFRSATFFPLEANAGVVQSTLVWLKTNEKWGNGNRDRKKLIIIWLE